MRHAAPTALVLQPGVELYITVKLAGLLTYLTADRVLLVHD